MSNKHIRILGYISLLVYLIFVFWFCVFSRTETVYEVRQLGWSFYGMWNQWWQGFLYLQTIGNVLLYVPIGYLSTMAMRPRMVVKPIVIGSSVCSVVEIMQCVNSCGTLDYDDFINNIVGTVVGYLVYKGFIDKKCSKTLIILIGLYVILGLRVLYIGKIK